MNVQNFTRTAAAMVAANEAARRAHLARIMAPYTGQSGTDGGTDDIVSGAVSA